MASQRSGCLLLLATLVAVANACSPRAGGKPPSADDDIRTAEVILYGRIERTYPDGRFSYGEETTAYTAQMRVYCVLKGSRTHVTVNITEAGYVPGLCTSTDLQIGSNYILPLTRDDVLYARYAQIDATEEKLHMVADVCGVTPQYPIGVKGEDARIKCPVLTAKNCEKKTDKRCFGDGCNPKSDYSHSGTSALNTSIWRTYYVLSVVLASIFVRDL